MDLHREPPPGGDHNKGPTFLAVSTTTTTVIAFVLVCLRIYVRTRVVRAVGWDDWMIIIAMASNKYPGPA